jgi:FkbH-like protein
MELLEALEVLNQPAAIGESGLRLFLGCGFTPLHLKTFTAAHIRVNAIARPVRIETGRFGDLAGSLERLDPSTVDAMTVVVEWFDLDSRLGIRELGSWKEASLADLLVSVETSVGRLEQAVERLARSIPVFVVMPTLPLPPAFSEPLWQSGQTELRLRAIVASTAATLSAVSRVVVLGGQELDRRSPPGSRLDIASAIATGFPYTMAHADALGRMLAEAAVARAPKKGLITDLDDTVWSGLVGEVGSAAVAWSLGEGALVHGLYQQTLAALASSGVLVAVASKNEPATVAETFARPDMLLHKDDVFPFEVTWGRKSESIGRILQTWNISADAVVFVDDNPMEVAEVQSAFPQMQCRVFPKSSAAAVLSLLGDLRNLFGKSHRFEEDALRAESIRRTEVARREQREGGFSEDEFLKAAGARIVFERPADTRRSFELLNKTNQFNLNGRRLDEAAWKRYLDQDGAFLLVVDFEDKYARLGQIAVLLGVASHEELRLDHWVMSCRAFSRRIEHQCLKVVFDTFGVDAVALDYDATPRNQPLQEFLAQILGTAPQNGTLRLTRRRFEASVPPLFHVIETRLAVTGRG